MIHSADQQQEIDRLTELNRRLANQIVNMTDTLEEARRELLAQGWDAGIDRAASLITTSGDFWNAVKEQNPYRKPIDL